MQLYIKNMVCPRCKSAVKRILEQNGLHPILLFLGEVKILEEKLNNNLLLKISNALSSEGFELLSAPNKIVTDKIKSFIITHVHYHETPYHLKFSTLLSQHLNKNYSDLSKLFSQEEGITIEQFQIHHKIEKVKEMLLYNELSLSQIALELNYSSVAHLSTQFKKLTNQTPSEFKKNKINSRKSLDSI